MEILEQLIELTEQKMKQAREDNPSEYRCSGAFPFAKCIVTFSMNRVHKNIEVWDPIKNTYLDCISEHLIAVTPNFDDFDVEESDVWNTHGFRDEQDYINYKYR